MRLFIFLIITVALPIAWLAAEFKARPRIRRILGITALLWSFGVASLVGLLRDFQANEYFSFATKDLLDASIHNLKSGKPEVVLMAWEKASDSLHPTYENKADYRKIVDQAILWMESTEPDKAPEGTPVPVMPDASASDAPSTGAAHL